MEPSTTNQIRQKIESIKEFQRLNAPSRASYFGYLGEFFLGCIILVQLVVTDTTGSVTIFGIPHFIRWMLLLISLILITHGLYLIFRFHSDKRIRKILESILTEATRQSELSTDHPSHTKKTE